MNLTLVSNLRYVNLNLNFYLILTAVSTTGIILVVIQGIHCSNPDQDSLTLWQVPNNNNKHNINMKRGFKREIYNNSI